MANIALANTARVEVVQSHEQHTLPAGEAITPGAPVRISGGTFVNGNGTTATEAAVYGIAVGDRAVVAGEAITAVAEGILDGFDFGDQDTNDPIYLSNTDATLADTAGTVSTVVGTVIPGRAASLGSYDKLLQVDL